MFELSIVWWKMKGDPDPDQTPEWTSVIAGTHSLTPMKTVARLQSVFNIAKDESMIGKGDPFYTKGYVTVYLKGNIEKNGILAQAEYAPANRPLPAAHGDIVPAMRVRYVASEDFKFEYGNRKSRMDEAILRMFGATWYPYDEDYIPAEKYLAKRLAGTSVLWRDAHHVWFCLPYIPGDEEVETLEYEPEPELWPPRLAFEKSCVYAELEKKLGEHLPGWYFRKSVMNG